MDVFEKRDISAILKASTFTSGPIIYRVYLHMTGKNCWCAKNRETAEFISATRAIKHLTNPDQMENTNTLGRFFFSFFLSFICRTVNPCACLPPPRAVEMICLLSERMCVMTVFIESDVPLDGKRVELTAALSCSDVLFTRPHTTVISEPRRLTVSLWPQLERQNVTYCELSDHMLLILTQKGDLKLGGVDI